ncbi:jupiter microtubule associated homolog 2-like isoform X1 [Pristis pectinata]|uniref:jupiter microtubule associated homolog 2-like isoform X1 n=1 Tax=Pristis pectinata TaxID=685728 RepID=UPI00223CE271|nr:jupiter microtubule associated homolog 2-like isoform X1 [Pristis pectinata]
MTTTTTYQGLDSTGRSSSRVLQPPGGGSSISFGVEENVKPVHSRPNKTASNIFGPPVESQPVARRSNPPGGKSSGIFGAATTETPDLKQRRNPPGGKTSGIFDTVKTPPKTLDIATGEGENCPGSSETANQPEAQGEKEESVPSPVSAQPESFRPKKVPPGGVSSLVLG